ncbi:MAG: hypothetical protein QOF68_3128 [Gaiellales bacterium]|nr:hypothetical protein [Gaiellales bacterium]
MAAEGVLVLTNARLVDGTGARPREGVDVVLDGGVIASVGEGRIPADAETLDLGGRTILPGLVDAHVHLASLGDLPVELRPHGVAEAARQMLAGGITTVRDCGTYGRVLFDLRDAIDRGLCEGPRLVLCGQIVAATCAGARAFSGMYREANGSDECRKATREQIAAGADFIKVMSTGALTVEGENVRPAQLTSPEMDAVVDEAHRLGFRVASHAEGADGVRLSVQAGVDTIEHGEMAFEAPEALAQMADQGIILVPTLCVFDAVVDNGERFSACLREQAQFLRESSRKTVEAARSAGVPIAMGADAGPHGENARELVLLADAGLSPMEAIVASTRISAEACGVDHLVGTVEAGKAADLLVVDGDPLADPRILLDREQLWLVLKDGERVAGALTAV